MQNNFPKAKVEGVRFGHIFLNVFSVVFIAFAVHRFLTFKFLSEAVIPESPMRAFLVGSLSDLWVGFLLALVISPVSFAARKIGKYVGDTTQTSFVLVFTGILSLHQGYVEFFKFQIEPFHLSYLTDLQFIDSNAASFITTNNLILSGIVVVASFLMYFRKDRFGARKRSWTAIGFLAVIALIAHNRNIHYRVQWFIPENLQTNVFESLYLRFKKLGPLERLQLEDFLVAKKLYNNGSTAHVEDRYKSTIYSYSLLKNRVTHPVSASLKQTFQQQVDSGLKPIIIIVLLESLRPAETGLFAPDQKSLTPR